MIILTRAASNDRWLTTPGTWRGARLADGHRTATVSCPGCGRAASLSDHEIAVDGTVSPSLVCPYADDPERPCAFHDHVRLEGWAP